MRVWKPILIGISVIVGIVFLGAIALIMSSNHVNRKSLREIKQLVSEIKAGTSFAVARQHLGEPTQVFTNSEAIEMWGTTKDKGITTNCLLHVFVRGIPLRWVLIYTDRDTNTVVYADWKDI